MRWILDAACREISNPDIFFSKKPGEIAKAKSLCRSCPAKEQCLQFAVDNCISHGTWGGESNRGRIGLPKTPPKEDPYCTNGHRYTEVNMYITRQGYRRCRKCLSNAMKKHAAKD